MFDENKLLNDIKNIENLTHKISPPPPKIQQQQQQQIFIDSYKSKFLKNNPVLLNILICIFIISTIHIVIYISDIEYVKRYHLSDETKLYEQTIDHSIIIMIDVLILLCLIIVNINVVNFV